MKLSIDKDFYKIVQIRSGFWRAASKTVIPIWISPSFNNPDAVEWFVQRQLKLQLDEEVEKLLEGGYDEELNKDKVR